MAEQPGVPAVVVGSTPAPRRRPRWRPSALTAYAGGVGLLGAGAMLAVSLQDPPSRGLTSHALPLVVLAAALVLGELKAISVPRGNDATTPVTISTIFAVALVILGPLSFALAATSVAILIDDVRTRRSPLQVLFNCGQYALSLVVARLAYCSLSSATLLGGPAPFTGDHLLAALVAGTVFAVVNDVLVGVVVALASGERVRSVLLDDSGFKLQASAVLVGLAPVTALLLKESVLMLPLLVLPILTVGRAAQLAVLREKQSMHDPLTGLANRLLLRLAVERALVSPRTPGLAVLMLDLDHFKDVNDTLGHHVGDQLLCAVAGRISEAAQGCGTDAEVARLGGDEFAVLLVLDRPRERAVAFAEQLLRELSRPVDVQGTRLSVQASVGITTTDGGPLEDVHTALKQADIALYEAKRERARACVFDPGGVTTSTERVRLLPQLQEAIEARQLAVVYQPQVDASSGRVVSVEALVRWDHPTQGRLAPAAFIDLAESAGLIAPITTFVLEEALAAAARWEASGWPIGVSVNVSARQLSDLALPGHVAGLLLRAGVPASRLTVEVTESSLMADPRAARTILRELRDMGVRLSIDDFGTGYSSLALLQELDLDEIKVDRSFVLGMAGGGHDDVLVRSIVELGHNMGLSVVAEGVETQALAHHLRELGCDLLQGYLFGRPVEAGAVEQLLDAQRARRPAGTHPPHVPDQQRRPARAPAS